MMWQEKAIDVEANARHCAKTCFFHLRRIRQLRRYVDHDILYKLICALILSRLDYCNSFLFACNSESTLHRLLQDAAAIRPMLFITLQRQRRRTQTYKTRKIIPNKTKGYRL